MSSVRAVLIALMLGLCGMAGIFVVTAPYGLRLSSDSATYDQVARSFGAGQGLVNYFEHGELKPMTHFPPLYPVLLSVGPYVGLDVTDWARVFNAFLFGLNVFFVAMIAFHFTGRWKDALVSGGAMLFFVHGVEIHAFMLSEPLFLSFLFMTGWFLTAYVETGRRGFFIAMAVASCACVMTRYAGIAVVITGAIALGVLSPGSWAKRSWDMLSYVFLSLVFPAAWCVRNFFVRGSPLGFDPGFSSGSLGGLGPWADSFSQYILPVTLPVSVRVLVAVVIVGFLFKRVRGYDSGRQNARLVRGLKLAGIFGAVYLLTTVTGSILSGGAIVLDPRILLPLPVIGLVFLPAAVDPKGFVNAGCWGMVFCVVIAGIMIARTVRVTRGLYDHGSGYVTREIMADPFIKTIKALADVPVYTNDPQAFYIYTGRYSVFIPRKGWDVSYFGPLEKIREDFISRKAVAVIFDGRGWEHSVWWRLVRETPLKVAVRDLAGAVYVASEVGKGR